MPEQGPDLIGQESARRYEAHKENVKDELQAELGVNNAERTDVEVRWENMHGRGDKMISQEESAKRVEAAQDDLDLAHKATEAQIEQTRNWKDKNLEPLMDSAKSDDEAREKSKPITTVESGLRYILEKMPPSKDWGHDYVEFLNQNGIKCSGDEVIAVLKDMAFRGIVEWKEDHYEIAER